MLRADGDDLLVTIRVRPRARNDEVGPERAGALLVSVTAPPVDGKANDAVCRLLAKALGVAPSRLSVQRGGSARDKVVRAEGVTIADAQRSLGVSR